MAQPDDLRETLDQLVAALNRFLTGDPGGLLELWSHSDDVTVFGGFGSYERGWEGVKQNTEWAASRFSGGQLSVEPLAASASGDLAYSVWLEQSEVRVPGRDSPAPITLRVTHIFRRENGAWKLIHRHGDPIVEKTELTAVLRDT